MAKNNKNVIKILWGKILIVSAVGEKIPK